MRQPSGRALREQIQEKWKPVFRPDLRLTKELERFRDTIAKTL
jgi:hypothetical protein